MAKEYPRRESCFWAMVAALRPYLAEIPMPEADLFNYLGRPDQSFVTNKVLSKPGQSPMTNEITLLAYLFERPGETKKWAATALLAEGKVQDIRLGDVSENEVVPFRAYLAGSAPNQQGGANGRQPFSSETNRTPSAAGSRR